MIYNIKGGTRTGCVEIPASKSQAHRLLICAALSSAPSRLSCDGISKDIEATIKCLNALGADIKLTDEKILEINPIKIDKNSENTECGETKHLYCGESGSTLRFLIPVVGALGADAVFHMEGLLSSRPIDALVNAVTAHGMTIEKEDDLLFCSGQMTAGYYNIPGNISSQYISGLLFSLPLLDGGSILEVTGPVESEDYIVMTENAIKFSGITYKKDEYTYLIDGNQSYQFPENAAVEQDWSNAAFFLCMGAMSSKGVTIKEMPAASSQGDAEIMNILKNFGADITIKGKSITVKKGKLMGQTIDARKIPDLVPTVCALASCAEGTTRIINAERLKIKESNRLQTTADMLNALGADVKVTDDGLIVNGMKSLKGGEIDPANDHRIAMAAAVAAGYCKDETIVNHAECVRKSFPEFWNHLEKLEVS